MRKDWIRTDEERELRRLRNLTKEERKLNKSFAKQQPIIDLPIVVRKKKRILQTMTKPVTQELVVQRIEPVHKNSLLNIE
jgi:hypothetical protein